MEPAPRWYYVGPMFRYERPQAGRYRQFFQIGVEAFGVAEPTVEADIRRDEVARAAGAELDDLVAAGDRGAAVETMGRGAAEVVARLRAAGIGITPEAYADAEPIVSRLLGGEIARYVFGPQQEFIRRVDQDPVLSRVKLIAEPWDVGSGGYQVGNFPPGWAEWNDQYRDTVRRYWRGGARAWDSQPL